MEGSVNRERNNTGEDSLVPSSKGGLESIADSATAAATESRYFALYNYHDRLDDPMVAPDEALFVPFPERFHEFLSSLSSKERTIVSWLRHGRAFKVHNREQFLQLLSSKSLKYKKMASVQGQLNVYGFHRLTAGPDRVAYYHEYFLASRPDLCHSICRLKIRGAMCNPGPRRYAEPQFYFMKPSPVPARVTRKRKVQQDPPHSFVHHGILKLEESTGDDDMVSSRTFAVAKTISKDPDWSASA